MQATAATAATAAAVPGTTTASLNVSAEVAMLSAFSAVVSALIALVALFIQTRRARRLLAIDLMFRFDDRFNSQAFQQTRAAAARALLGESKGYTPVDDVLDFFETIGLLARRRVLDLEMAWSTFFNWLDGYWNAASGYVREERGDSNVTWQDADALYNKLRAIEKKKTGCGDSDFIWLPEDIDSFLEAESTRPDSTTPRRRGRSTKVKRAKPRTEPPQENKPTT